MGLRGEPLDRGLAGDSLGTWRSEMAPTTVLEAKPVSWGLDTTGDVQVSQQGAGRHLAGPRCGVQPLQIEHGVSPHAGCPPGDSRSGQGTWWQGQGLLYKVRLILSTSERTRRAVPVVT